MTILLYLFGLNELGNEVVFRTMRVLATLFCIFLSICTLKADDPIVCNRTDYGYQMAPLDYALITFADGATEKIIIDPDGYIQPGNSSNHVQGMSVEHFRALIKRKYPRAKEVKIVEFRPDRISVLGEVFHQINSPMTEGPMRLLDGIAAANGFTPLANRRRVSLIRQNAGSSEVFEINVRDLLRGKNLSHNLLLEPGDIISVPRNFL